MKDVNILESTIEYRIIDKKKATHFMLVNKEKARYFISLNHGKKRLTENLSTYSVKLSILMKILRYMPFYMLKRIGLGEFVEVSLCPEISDFIKINSCFNDNWNLIVGTYDSKQKVVVQVWDKNEVIYYKIGNHNSNKEMLTEINYLKMRKEYKKFTVPKIIDSQLLNQKNKFNIQVTKEFLGKKVDSKIKDEIYEVFEELVQSRGIEIKHDIAYGFSHGDFAPWNMKKTDNGYILFDWEHCGIRFYGFDIIHYIYQIESLLKGKSEDEAFEVAFDYFNNKCCKYNYNKDNIKKMYFEEYYKIH